MIQLIIGGVALLGMALAAQVSLNIDMALFDLSAAVMTLFGVVFYFFLFFGQEGTAEFLRTMKKFTDRKNFLPRQKLLAEWFVRYAWAKEKMQPTPDVPGPLKSEFMLEALGHMERGILMPEMLREVLIKSAQSEFDRHARVREKVILLARFIPTISVLAIVIAALSRISGLYHPLTLTPMAAIVKFATLTALYTFIITFFVLLPLSEKIGRDNERRLQHDRMIIEGIYRLMRKENPFHILERLNAMQPMELRLRWKDLALTGDGGAHVTRT